MIIAATRLHDFKGLVAAALLGLSLAFAPAPAAAQAHADVSPHPMFVENISPANLPTTVDAFLAEVRAAGWSHLDTINMSGVLSARGFTLDPVLILEVCSGRYSAALLDSDETRYVASMIPCRVAIYQTSDDRVIISRMNTAAFAQMMPGEVGQVIAASGAEVDAIIAATLARLNAPEPRPTPSRSRR